MKDFSIRDIIERFSHDTELLKAILKAKQDELKFQTEELNLQAEKVRLEIRRLDNEGVKDDTSPTSQFNYHSPPKSSYAYNSIGSIHTLDYPAKEDNPFNSNRSFPHRHIMHQDKESNTLPPLHHNVESNKPNPTTIQLKDAPPPIHNHLKRRLSREKVMEALRNKIHHNKCNQAKNKPNGPALAPINPPNIAHPNICTSPSKSKGKLPTLSALQPRNVSSPGSNSLGPFSAPVGGPHPGFQFPPPSSLDSNQSKHHTPDS